VVVEVIVHKDGAGALMAGCVLARHSVMAAIAVMAQLSRKLFLVISGPFQCVGKIGLSAHAHACAFNGWVKSEQSPDSVY